MNHENCLIFLLPRNIHPRNLGKRWARNWKDEGFLGLDLSRRCWKEWRFLVGTSSIGACVWHKKERIWKSSEWGRGICQSAGVQGLNERGQTRSIGLRMTTVRDSVTLWPKPWRNRVREPAMKRKASRQGRAGQLSLGREADSGGGCSPKHSIAEDKRVRTSSECCDRKGLGINDLRLHL